MADPEDGAAGAPDEAYDASDKDQVDKRKRTAGRRKANVRSAFAAFLSTTDGRNWMWDLLVKAHVFAPSFTTDPHLTAFNEGQRSVALDLMLDFPPESMLLMLKEQGNG